MSKTGQEGDIQEGNNLEAFDDLNVSRIITSEDQTPPEEENTDGEQSETINKDVDAKPEEAKPEVDQIQALSQKIEFLSKQFAASQSFIGKQSSEIGRLRKELQAKAEPVDPKKFLNDFVENPTKALEAEMERREQEKAKANEEVNANYQTNLQMVLQAVPNIDALIPSMIEELVADGVQNPSIDMIKASIQTEPHLVLNYAKRAAYKQQLVQTEAKGKQMIEKVANGSRKAPTTQGKSLAPQKEKTISSRELRNMSDEELAKLYATMSKR